MFTKTTIIVSALTISAVATAGIGFYKNRFRKRVTSPASVEIVDAVFDAEDTGIPYIEED